MLLLQEPLQISKLFFPLSFFLCVCVCVCFLFPAVVVSKAALEFCKEESLEDDLAASTHQCAEASSLSCLIVQSFAASWSDANNVFYTPRGRMSLVNSCEEK